MSEKILEERGLFWWHDEPIPENQFAPDNCVAGTLTIAMDGSASLDLDGYLPNEQGPFQVLSDQNKVFPPNTAIQGKLKGKKDNNVLLFKLRKSGSSFSTHGMSHERYVANACLVAQTSLPTANRSLLFASLNVELKGLEQWLGLGNIGITRSRKRVTVKYRKPEDEVYTLSDGTLVLSYLAMGIWPGKSRLTYREDELNLVERAVLCYKPKKRRSLEEMIEQYSRIQELFILLTGSEYAIEWPWLTIGKSSYELYFRTLPRSTDEPPSRHECWTNFTQLRSNFGSLFDAWRRKREELGPGAYLYLGLRRGMKMFVEHRFVNLIWGLESLHRRKSVDTNVAAKLEKKIERILSQIEAQKDRRWLEGRLKNAGEPSLKERLLDIFSGLLLNFDAKALDAFCSECANRRNDVSHYGGVRSEGSYSDFITDLDRKSSVLKVLYHAALLKEIGVEQELVSTHVRRPPSIFYLKQSNLSPKSSERKTDEVLAIHS